MSRADPYANGIRGLSDVLAARVRASDGVVLAQGNPEATRGKLGALLHEVQAQRGRKLDASVADTLAAALAGMVAAL